MAHLSSWGNALGLSLVLWAAPLFAHTVKVSGDVAATFHIEPNHNPKAGEPAQAWFVLTQRGGVLVPLAKCDCKLAVHLEPHQEGDLPVVEPVLKSIATEGYPDVPGTQITFPKPGKYVLELRGEPRAGGQFQPFELSYEVTVASQAKVTADSPKSVVNQDQDAREAPIVYKTELRVQPFTPLLPLLIAGSVLVGLGVVGFALKRSR
ncbi:MAG: hypothetical protein WCD18_27715 [Thermosynechococcaceae cyanobacterium]